MNPTLPAPAMMPNGPWGFSTVDQARFPALGLPLALPAGVR